MSLNTRVLEIRQRQRIKLTPLDMPSAVWTGKDHVDGNVENTLTMIFRTSGCWWGKVGGCTMCGYVYDSAHTSPSADDLVSQFRKAMVKASKFDRFMVKIFTSGSFLDEKEVPADARSKILSLLEEEVRVFKVVVESRPEFLTDESMKFCLAHLKDTLFEVAIGLETSSDLIRKHSINKGFTFRDFTRAAEVAKANSVAVKTYLMLKPPFISEKQALEDIVTSVKEASAYSSVISINLCNVQKGTLIEYLWERGEYRPPWLWSIVEILKRTKQEFPHLTITSDPVGAGSKRGPRNCKECSGQVADAIRAFSLSQDLHDLEGLECDCRHLWKKVLVLDDLSFGSSVLE
ncbi:archaeosine biosynthesis radical SAM protein RaSEA [Methanomethylovorans sp.]|uniref:archaeosine biosynthesis radical SAM protein RaSEA n=1 Tax=Methanomethylovorans sp. TaxID=2758717 RepID=UPI00351C13A1